MTEPPTPPARVPAKFKTVRLLIRKSWRWLLGILGLGLAWQALGGVAWDAVRDLLSGLGPPAVLIILGINLLMLPVMTVRWWLLIRALGASAGLPTVCAYRLAANAVSYLTPGPHFGGEPLSVYLLHKRQGMSLSSATTSVAVDRLLELLASIVVLAFCLLGLAFAQGNTFAGSRGLIMIIALPAVFASLLAALFTDQKPLSRSFSVLQRLVGGSVPGASRNLRSLTGIIAQAEIMATSLFRGNRRRFLLVNLLSLVHWLGVFAEFWVMAALLGISLSFWQLTAVVGVARLAFFTPLPAGIGVLETALPWATAALGLGGALGISLCLIIRFRDLLFSLTGLGLAMHYLTCRRKASIIDEK